MEILALKPAHGFDFVTKHEGATIVSYQSWFMPLESPEQPTDLGLSVACNEYKPKLRDEFIFAARIVLETGLGESLFAELRHIDVERTPSDPEARGYMKLADLERYVKWHLAKVASGELPGL